MSQIFASTSCHTVQSLPRSAETLHLVSAKRLASLGVLTTTQHCYVADHSRFETRDTAERVIKNYHSLLNEQTGVKLFLRFADTKAQKQLKLQSQERRSWRSREYSYSVEHTPSPVLTRFHNVGDGHSPSSYQSPAGASHSYTPDTSVSPP